MAEPPLTLHAIHDDGPGNLQPTRIVIHATCPNIGYPAASAPGRALSTARYFQSPAAGGSAHYVVDPAGEQHCVPDAHIAWHSPPNPRSIGIEICAEGGDYPRSYSRAQWLSDPVWPAVQRAAARTRELCQRFGIPAVKLSVADLQAGRHGICGHVDVSRAFHQSSHSDPGAGFPWPEFLALVTQPANPAPRSREDDVMYIKCRPDPRGPVWTAILSGPFFVQLATAGELKSVEEAIAKGAIAQWVEKVTWDDLDRRSHNVCAAAPPVIVTDAPAK